MKQTLCIYTESLLAEKIIGYLQSNEKVINVCINTKLDFTALLKTYCSLHDINEIVFIDSLISTESLKTGENYIETFMNSLYTLKIPVKSIIVVDSKSARCFENLSQELVQKNLILKVNNISGYIKKGNELYRTPSKESFLIDEFILHFNEIRKEYGIFEFINIESLESFLGITLKNKDEQYETIKRQQRCIFNLIYKLHPHESFLGSIVAKKRFQLGYELGKNIAKTLLADMIIPVPNTGIYYAQGAAYSSGIPYIQALMKLDWEERSFFKSIDERKKIILDKIVSVEDFIKGKKVIVIDEAIFTGTTLKLICEMLKEVGVEKIDIYIPTPKCYKHCPYYMMPQRAMLLEYVRETDLCHYFDGADSISFIPYSKFHDTISDFGWVCEECFEEN